MKRRESSVHSGARPAFEALESRLLLSYTVLISEFMADNESTLQDVDQAYSDWIEIQNVTSSPVNLEGWELRDSSDQWTFPAVTIGAGQYLVVFASSKNRRDPASSFTPTSSSARTASRCSCSTAAGLSFSRTIPSQPSCPTFPTA